jgi:hypothetical protein
MNSEPSRRFLRCTTPPPPLPSAMSTTTPSLALLAASAQASSLAHGAGHHMHAPWLQGRNPGLFAAERCPGRGVCIIFLVQHFGTPLLRGCLQMVPYRHKGHTPQDRLRAGGLQSKHEAAGRRRKPGTGWPSTAVRKRGTLHGAILSPSLWATR